LESDELSAEAREGRDELSAGARAEREELSAGARVESDELSAGARVEREELSVGARAEREELSAGAREGRADVMRDELSAGARVERDDALDLCGVMNTPLGVWSEEETQRATAPIFFFLRCPLENVRTEFTAGASVLNCVCSYTIQANVAAARVGFRLNSVFGVSH
jgi:hypothetical protein